MCWGNFCYIPGPKKWDENARAYMLGWLPTVGFFIGAIWAAIYTGLITIQMPFMAVCVIALWLPFILSGFIHVDGYMDVNDALMSRGSLEKKRAILKDSRCGTFAIVSLIFLLIIEFGFLSSAISYGIDIVNLVLITVISRSVSGLAVLNFTPMETSQYSAMKGVKKENKDSAEQGEASLGGGDCGAQLYEDCSEAAAADGEQSGGGDGERCSEDCGDSGGEQHGENCGETADGNAGYNGGEACSEQLKNGEAASTGSANILLLVQLIIYLVLVGLFCTYYLATALVFVSTVLGAIIPILLAKRQLKGMNGDIAGYGILWGEMIGMMTLVFC